MIGVYARVNHDGKPIITLTQTTDSARFLRCARMLAESMGWKEWQATTHETLADLKSSLMADYGIDWYNRARSALRTLECAA